jgi:translation elongation factor EF-G
VAKRRVAIMRVDVTTSEPWLGDVMQDLADRRGQIVGIEARQPGQVVRAVVALPDLLDYAQALGAITGGRGIYEARFSHWQSAEGGEPDDGAGVPSPLRPIDPTLEAGAAAEPPPSGQGSI